MINTKEIIDLISDEINQIISVDNVYKGISIHISNEQQFIKEKTRKTGSIYIVVKFGQASVNFGQIMLPATISAVSEQNNVVLCQRLLMEFANTYTLKWNDNDTIKQIYTSPSDVINFNDVFDDYRSVFNLAATFLISENTNPIKKIEYGVTVDNVTTYSQIDCITSALSFSTQPDTQPYTMNNNFTSTINKTGTRTLALVSYLVDNGFFNDCLDIMMATKDLNLSYNMKITFKNNKSYTGVFKLISFDLQQDVGNLPIISVTLTN